MKGNKMRCPDCGMGYVPEVPEDMKSHKKYHDKVVHGIPTKPAKSDRVIWREGTYRIAVVDYTSPDYQRKRAQEAAFIANRETHYSPAPYHASESMYEFNTHVFLLYYQNRIIGLLIMDRRSQIWKCTWEEFEKGTAQDLCGHPPMWSISFIWIHNRHKRHGLAKRLVAEALSFLKTNVNSIGWNSPFTELGKIFVKRICPDYIYIAK